MNKYISFFLLLLLSEIANAKTIFYRQNDSLPAIYELAYLSFNHPDSVVNAQKITTKKSLATSTLPSKTWLFRKGRQHATPLFSERFIKRPKYLRWECRFDSSCRYRILNWDGSTHHDQYDWLKLSGVTFTPWFTHGNTAMVGWRYNHKKDSFELNTYFHVKGGTFFTDNPHICVGVNEDFITEIELTETCKEIAVRIITPRDTLTSARQYPYFRKWICFIHPFFGGTAKAPHNIYLRNQLVAVETEKNTQPSKSFWARIFPRKKNTAEKWVAKQP